MTILRDIWPPEENYTVKLGLGNIRGVAGVREQVKGGTANASGSGGGSGSSSSSRGSNGSSSESVVKNGIASVKVNNKSKDKNLNTDSLIVALSTNSKIEVS